MESLNRHTTCKIGVTVNKMKLLLLSLKGIVNSLKPIIEEEISHFANSKQSALVIELQK